MPIGRPPHYTDPEVMQVEIDKYFNDPKCDYTISGLAYDLGFADKRAMYDYEKKPEFNHSIKRARARIERHIESDTTTAPGLTIFKLKNFGWKDKTEVDNTHNFVGNPQIKFGDTSK